MGNQDQQSPAPAAPPPLMKYEDWFRTIVNVWTPVPNTWPATSWTPDTIWGARILSAMHHIERDYAETLIQSLEADGVRGPIVEFGVFEGRWLRHLIGICEANNLMRDFYGFDSFKGLPATSKTHDLDCFEEGQFRANLASVANYLEMERRSNVRLLEGWFSDTLPLPEVQRLDNISYARIDCDLYAPALECLNFLAPRLADKAILVFDDWTFDCLKGETRAFAEWIPGVPHLRFEFLTFTGVGHLYLRVLKST